MKLSQLLTLIAMLISASAPILPDTTPGSERSIAVALAGVVLAVVVLVQSLNRDPNISSRQSPVLTPPKVVFSVKYPRGTETISGMPGARVVSYWSDPFAHLPQIPPFAHLPQIPPGS